VQGLGGELAAFNLTNSAASSSGQYSVAGHFAAPLAALLLIMAVVCELAALDNRSLHHCSAQLHTAC
jgi:hypothetical protein